MISTFKSAKNINRFKEFYESNKNKCDLLKLQISPIDLILISLTFIVDASIGPFVFLSINFGPLLGFC